MARKQRGESGFALACALATVAACILAVPHAEAAGGTVRPAAVAGAFYPGSAKALRKAVDEALAEARPHVPSEFRTARPRAIIVPHAGYRYSGATAALAYKLLEGKDKPSRVILMGPSHHVHMVGACSVADVSAYATPLGEVPVDAQARAALTSSDLFRSTRLAHASEHCLEVQIPFLQVLWAEPPKILPIVTGALSPAQCRAAAAQIAQLLDEDALLIVSTDFTHYGRRFGYAPFQDTPSDQLRDKIRELDMEGVGHIENMDPAGFRKYQASRQPTICGRQAVSLMLDIFCRSPSSRPVFLQWSNSGEITGGYSDCVSYVALAVYAPAEALDEIRSRLDEAAGASAAAGQGPPELTHEEKVTLVQLARRVLEERLVKGNAEAASAVRLDQADLSETLCAPCGLFVTLTKEGRLRGCVGRLVSDEPLYSSVTRVALLAALEDPRFTSVGTDELGDIRIEISVLGGMTRVSDVADVRVGRDGLLIQKDGRSGVLLPQVAVDNDWTPTAFLENTCRKAGLPKDAWQTAGASTYRFQATVFGEEELKAE